MKLYRTADALPIARANAQKLQQEQQAQVRSEDAKQQRRELNRRLAEKLVNSWSALEYRERYDNELARALDGQHAGIFDINAERYRKEAAERRAGGSDADAASYAARQQRKRKEAQFVSNQLGRNRR